MLITSETKKNIRSSTIDQSNEEQQDIRVLIIPDSHAAPGLNNDRFTWLGRMIVDLKPDEVWCGGDLWDFPSLSSYDKGKRSFEGRRYVADLEAGLDAQEKLWAPLAEYNAQRREGKRAQYHPYKLFVAGNHDQARIERVTQMHPELEGAIGVKDLKLDKYWDEVCEFKERTVRHGFALSHYFPSGVMGQPIGGLHAANSLLTKMGMSCIAFHSHLWDEKIMTRADGSKMMAIVAGCYTHPDMIEGWNKDTHQMWMNCITILDGVSNGFAESVTRISQDRIRKIYG